MKSKVKLKDSLITMRDVIQKKNIEIQKEYHTVSINDMKLFDTLDDYVDFTCDLCHLIDEIIAICEERGRY